MGKKIGRNDPWPCGSGKKYKRCCLGKEKQSKEVNMLPLPQLFQFIKSGLETQSAVPNDQNKKIRVKNVDIINDDTLLCEIYPYANKSMEIKLEIGSIMSFLASFWKDNPHVPGNIQSLAVKAFTSQDEELIYAISPKHIAELMSEGRSIEWLQNTIFQDNSDDYRVTLAKRQISEIENALREVICDVLNNNHGVQWWDNYIDSDTRRSARSVYRNQTGTTSSDGSVLISYTYLLQLKRILTDNWSDFSHIFQSRTNFEAWLDDLNSIRREEAHNRPITHAHIANLKQIYNDIMREVGQNYPDAVSSYLSENWRERIVNILDDYSEKQNQLTVGRELGLDHNMATVISTIGDLSDVETRLSSIPVPPDKIDLHDELMNLIQNLKSSFEEMIECAKAGDVDEVEAAGRKNSEVNMRIKSFTEKILLGS